MKIKTYTIFICLILIITFFGCKDTNKDTGTKPIGIKETKANLLRNEGERLIDRDSFDRAIQVLKEATLLTNSNETKGICYNNIGFSLASKQEYEGALKYYLKAYTIFKKANNLTHLAQAQMNAASTLKIMGAYEVASKYAWEAKSIFEKDTSLINELGVAYNTLGNLNRELGNYDQAILYHRESYKIRLKKSNQDGIAACINNIGNVYFDKKQYDSAIFYFSKYKESSQRMGNNKKLGRAYENLAKTYLAKSYLIFAQKNIDSSWFYYSKIDYKPGFLSVSLIKSDFYKNSDGTLALYHALNALDISQTLHLEKEKSEALEKLGSIYAQQGNYAKAFSVMKAFQSLNDSIIGKEKIGRIHANIFLFETEKYKKELTKVENLRKAEILKRKNESVQRNIAIVGIVMLLILLYLLYWRYKDKLYFNALLSERNLILKKQNQSLENTREELEKENTFISKKIAAFQMNDGVYIFERSGPIAYKDIIKLNKRDLPEFKNDTQLWFYNNVKNRIEANIEHEKSLSHFESDEVEALPDFLFARISNDCIINLSRISKNKSPAKWEFYYYENGKKELVKIVVNRTYQKEFIRRFKKFTDLFQ